MVLFSCIQILIRYSVNKKVETIFRLSTASNLGLHCLSILHKKDFMPLLVKNSPDILNVEFVIKRNHSDINV